MPVAISEGRKTNRALALTLEKLAQSIHQLHECDASWVESVPVNETHEGRTVWQGIVHVFRLTGHPTAKLCYGWASPTDSGERVYAVLHLPPVSSPADAVRASIVSDFRQGR